MLLTLKVSVEAMGAWPMYQLFPASPVRPQIFLSLLPPPLTYTLRDPIPWPYMWVQNLRHRGPPLAGVVAGNSSLCSRAASPDIHN